MEKNDWRKLLEQGKIVNGLNGFCGNYASLSNFYLLDREVVIPFFQQIPFKDDYDDDELTTEYILVDNIETAYQSLKCKNIKDFMKFHKLSPKESKKLGRKVELREEWEKYKYDFMSLLIEVKKKECGKFVDTLLSIPKDMCIVEMNYWKDVYWGVDTKTLEGKNRLGEILMKAKKDLEDKINI